jgi:hypothetical protein
MSINVGFPMCSGGDEGRATRAATKAGVRLLLVVATACLLSACEGTPDGPSLADVPLTNIGLRPTLGDATACCCHVTGTVTNSNSVPVHVTIKFAAFQNATAPDPFASVVYFIEDLQPGARHNVDAAGFLVPCSAINLQFLRKELSVRGVTFPPH